MLGSCLDWQATTRLRLDRRAATRFCVVIGACSSGSRQVSQGRVTEAIRAWEPSAPPCTNLARVLAKFAFRGNGAEAAQPTSLDKQGRNYADHDSEWVACVAWADLSWPRLLPVSDGKATGARRLVVGTEATQTRVHCHAVWRSNSEAHAADDPSKLHLRMADGISRAFPQHPSDLVHYSPGHETKLSIHREPIAPVSCRKAIDGMALSMKGMRGGLVVLLCDPDRDRYIYRAELNASGAVPCSLT